VVVLDELKEEEIVNKVGGRFKLSTLIQKRMVQLNAGARALVEMKTHDKLAVVIQEILHDKIYLDLSGEVRERGGKERETELDGPPSNGMGDELG
jgi:DNA-directed RNA polymerase subunit omega